ncbi:MAG: hypothetical protein QOJ15_3749 [Bradyrhizobium sp.]|jgi:hypothetical protein|nr:hypothetical protein [Bradyrhizobium sp.]
MPAAVERWTCPPAIRNRTGAAHTNSSCLRDENNAQSPGSFRSPAVGRSWLALASAADNRYTQEMLPALLQIRAVAGALAEFFAVER